MYSISPEEKADLLLNIYKEAVRGYSPSFISSPLCVNSSLPPHLSRLFPRSISSLLCINPASAVREFLNCPFLSPHLSSSLTSSLTSSFTSSLTLSALLYSPLFRSVTLSSLLFFQRTKRIQKYDESLRLQQVAVEKNVRASVLYCTELYRTVLHYMYCSDCSFSLLCHSSHGGLVSNI